MKRNERPQSRPENTLTVEMGQPSIVAVSAPGERRWGHYQFPHIERLDDGRLIISYSVHADSVMSYGEAQSASVSADGGHTWIEAGPGEVEASATGAIVFPDGEAIKFPLEKPLDATKLKLPPNPVRHRDLYTRESDCYRLGDLPKDLQRFKLLRRLPGAMEWCEEWATLDIPDLVVRVWRREYSDIGWSDPNILEQPHIVTEFFHTFTPDGGLLNFQHIMMRFNRDGMLSKRSGVGVLRSDDYGRTWRLWGIPGWFRDEAEERAAAQPFLDDPDSNFNRLWGGKDTAPIPFFDVGGLYEPGVVSFGNGHMVCVMRTDTGGTHEPCFVARSDDWGKTWTTPEILTPFGVMPKLVLLDSGVIVLVYGRPGVQLLFCTDGKGEVWHTPMNLLPEAGEKTRAVAASRNHPNTIRNRTNPIDDTCGNCTVLKTGPDRFLVAYSDFRHLNADGQRCKAICVREVIIKVLTPK
ncbi:MAG: sialidase family protein [Verrucomicrobiota bacterium]